MAVEVVEETKEEPANAEGEKEEVKEEVAVEVVEETKEGDDGDKKVKEALVEVVKQTGEAAPAEGQAAE